PTTPGRAIPASPGTARRSPGPAGVTARRRCTWPGSTAGTAAGSATGATGAPGCAAGRRTATLGLEGDLGDELAAEPVELVRVAEEVRLVGRDLVEEARHLRRPGRRGQVGVVRPEAGDARGPEPAPQAVR